MRYIVGLGNPGEEYELTSGITPGGWLFWNWQKRGDGGACFDKKINALVGKRRNRWRPPSLKLRRARKKSR